MEFSVHLRPLLVSHHQFSCHVELMYHALTNIKHGISLLILSTKLEILSQQVMFLDMCSRMIFSLNTESWFHLRFTVVLRKYSPRDNIQ